MIDLAPMVLEEFREQFTTQDRRSLLLVAVAVLLVLAVVSVVLSHGQHAQRRTDFRDDCARLGGVPHDLGDQTLCLYGDKVIGRFG